MAGDDELRAPDDDFKEQMIDDPIPAMIRQTAFNHPFATNSYLLGLHEYSTGRGYVETAEQVFERTGRNWDSYSNLIPLWDRGRRNFRFTVGIIVIVGAVIYKVTKK